MCLILLAGTAHAAIVTPSEKIKIEWSEEEKALGIAKRTLFENDRSKEMMVRLTESEKLHMHDEDLIAWLVKGSALLHIENETYAMSAGDVARIPRRTYHWAELDEGVVCEIYAVYLK